MILDIIVAVILILAIIKGYRQGLIVALFSFIALAIGLAAALKLSVVVAGYIGKAVNVSDKWLPIVSFAVVFLIVVLLVKLGAKFIQKTVELAMLGWVNRVGGILLYAALYILIFSVLLFYADQMNFIKPETKMESVTYSYIQPWGPKLMEGLGKIIPIFKGMFEDLEDFFDSVSKHVPPAN
ncbi:MAG TPA: CvpA family protein [Chitinophagaceae bacterium]|jgi:membrane protein required for colicin V production|nr:CvpA family protein [Chitinophagaceae bacterium]